MAAKLELLKSRDFGELITDTFVFIKENFKPLMMCILIFCGFFIVAGAAFSALQQSKMLDVVNTAAYSPDSARLFTGSNPFEKFFTVEYFLAIFFLMLNYMVMPVAIYSFIALYREKGNIAPTPQEVWGYFKYFFFRILGSGIVLAVLFMVGCVLCIIPGIYLYPVFALIFPIIIFENASFGYAFSKSFKLIKGRWWETFGALFVMGLIVGVAAGIVILPTTVMNMSRLLLHPGKTKQLSVTLTVITAILQSLTHILYSVPFITAALIYFNLSEKTENTGLLGRIGQLGNLTPDDNLPTEEY